MFPEGRNQCRTAAQLSQGAKRMNAEFPEIPGAEIRQFMMFQMPPEILNGIQFRRVGGKAFQCQDPQAMPAPGKDLTRDRILSFAGLNSTLV